MLRGVLRHSLFFGLFQLSYRVQTKNGRRIQRAYAEPYHTQGGRHQDGIFRAERFLRPL